MIKEITSSNEEAETEFEDNTSEEDTENPVRDYDFEIFLPYKRVQGGRTQPISSCNPS